MSSDDDRNQKGNEKKTRGVHAALTCLNPNPSDLDERKRPVLSRAKNALSISFGAKPNLVVVHGKGGGGACRKSFSAVCSELGLQFVSESDARIKFVSAIRGRGGGRWGVGVGRENEREDGQSRRNSCLASQVRGRQDKIDFERTKILGLPPL